MPQVNGTKGHTFGQAYARDKAGKSTEVHDEPDGDEGESKGEPMLVTHKGDGKFKTQVKGEKPMHHESMEEMHEHMQEHFGQGNQGDEHAEEEMGSTPEEGVGTAVRSILG